MPAHNEVINQDEGLRILFEAVAGEGDGFITVSTTPNSDWSGILMESSNSSRLFLLAIKRCSG